MLTHINLTNIVDTYQQGSQMILIIKGKTYNLMPHQAEPSWLLVPPSEIQDFHELGVPLMSSDDGFIVLAKTDLLRRLTQVHTQPQDPAQPV